MSKPRQHFFDKPENLKRVLRVFYLLCVLLVAADFAFHRHVLHEWEHVWGFYCVFGFVACVVLVLTAKQMRRILMRSEDYYDAD